MPLQPIDPTAARHRRTALAVLATCFVLNMFGRGMGDTYAVFLLPLEREFGWTRSQLTGVYSLYLLVSGFAAPLVGLLFDRLGPRWVYGAGVACLGVAFFLAGSLGSLWQFYLLVGVMVGIGVGMTGMVPASGLLSRWYRARLSSAIGVAFSAVGMGAMTLVPLAQLVIEHYDWRTGYRVLGGMLLVLTLAVLWLLPWKSFMTGHPAYHSEGKGGGRDGGWTLREAMRTPIYWGLVQTFFCTASGMFAIMVQTVVILIDAGFAPLTAASAFGATGMLSVVSVTGSGFLSERFGYRQTVSASFAGTASGIVILFLLVGTPSAALLAAYVLVFGLCQGVRGPIISSVSARHFAGPNVATIYGTIYATNALGAAFGSLMGGVLHDLTGGYRVGFGFSLVMIGLAALPFWIVPALRTFR